VPSKVNVNTLTVVHAGSNGIAPSFPDVCKTPSSGGPIPIPYPNIAQSTDTAKGSKTVIIEGNPVMLEGSSFATSMGDEPGSAGGVLSNTVKGKAEFVNFSFDVKLDGKCVARLGDLMVHNKLSAPNTGPFPEMQPPCPMVPSPPPAEQEEEANEIIAVDLQHR
jgi:uncharacterized Zn-binding protein involved in type VI secretion